MKRRKFDRWGELAVISTGLFLMAWGHWAHAAKAGYELTGHQARLGCCQGEKGLAGRIDFGGGQDGDRYFGDRWTLSIGYVNPRQTDADRVTNRLDDGSYLYIPSGWLPSYKYATFTHNWFTKKGRIKWAPQLRAFVGTGIGVRDIETCGIAFHPTGARREHSVCFHGSVEVSSRACFAQEAGIVWRERLALRKRHCSTGGFSAINLGEDEWSLTIYPLIGKKRRTR